MNKSENAVNIFNTHASAYMNKFMDLDLYYGTFDTFCDHVPKENAEILEVACGPGNITRYLLNKRPDLAILATDLAPNMLELAQQNNPTAEFKLLDARNIKTVDRKFDAIMCGFCFPYLSKEEAIQFIYDAATMLNPGGVLYISTMEDDYTKSGIKTTSSGNEIYMHYHEAGYLTEALTNNGFELIELKRQDYPEEDGSVTIDLILIYRFI